MTNKKLPDSLVKTLNVFPQNLFFLLTITIILILPVIATTGQFLSSGYLLKTVPVLLMYWPGSDLSVHIKVYVWLFMGLAFISYIYGIGYLFTRHTLGKVVLITILIFISSGLIKN